MIWVDRNVRPSSTVSTRPACRPRRLPFFTDVSAQCIVKLDVIRIRVFTPATNFGRWNGGGGHWPFTPLLTTRSKK